MLSAYWCPFLCICDDLNMLFSLSLCFLILIMEIQLVHILWGYHINTVLTQTLQKWQALHNYSKYIYGHILIFFHILICMVIYSFIVMTVGVHKQLDIYWMLHIAICILVLLYSFIMNNNSSLINSLVLRKYL